MARELDESDVRVRPGRGSRPRTRRRPAHEGARPAQVTAVDRGRYTCRLASGETVTAVRAGELRRRAVVVGDRVALVGGGADQLARLVRVEARSTVLRRTPDDTDPVERPVVANADQLAVVMSVADPPPRPRLVDRCLVAAFDGGLTALLCLTKADLGTDVALRERWAPLQLPVVTVRRDRSLAELTERLAGVSTVLFGPSGVGKSSLVNRLVPGAGRVTAELGAGRRGRHATSAAVLLDLPGGGAVVDTPGVRSFGLGLVRPERVLAAFPDLAGLAADCPPRCDHLRTAGCALAAPPAPLAARARSYRRLLASISTLPPERQYQPPDRLRNPSSTR